MADVYTTPPTFVDGAVLAASELNTNVRDNVTALQLGLNGDGSTDSDAIHAHKQAAAGTTPPAAAKAGRIFLPVGQMFQEDGTSWYCIGPGPYDDFDRADSGTITPSSSGHTWTEESGTWKIASDALKLDTTGGIATLDTKGLLTRNYSVKAVLVSGATAGNIDMAIVLKYADANNYLYAQLNNNSLKFTKVIAGAGTTKTVSFTLNGSFSYFMECEVVASVVTVRVVRNDVAEPTMATLIQKDSDILHANFATATKVGLRMVHTQDSCEMFDVRF